MTKADCRTIFKEKRKNLSLSKLDDASLAIANQLLNLPIWSFDFYHIFLSITRLKEVNTEYILNILNGKDKNIVISKSNFELLSMSHYLLTDNTLIKKNTWGIPEPQNGVQISAEQLQVIFVPVLAFDKKGNRLGYGKGFYDRFLQECTEESLKIGISLFEAEEQIPNTPTDIPLTHCITPNKIYHF